MLLLIMLRSSYNQPVSKDRLDTYKKHFEHLNLTKYQLPPSAKAQGGVFSAEGTVNLFKNSLPEQDLQEETDQFIDQCIHEYITWLAETEVRRSKLALSLIEPFKTTDWSAIEHKEGTND